MKTNKQTQRQGLKRFKGTILASAYVLSVALFLSIITSPIQDTPKKDRFVGSTRLVLAFPVIR